MGRRTERKAKDKSEKRENMSNQQTIEQIQALCIHVSALKANLFKVKQENQRLRAHVHSPIVRLGSRFSIPSTSSSSLLLKIPPPVTPPAQTEEVGEVKKPSFKRSNSEPKVESPRRKLSCFTDDTVTVYDKFLPGLRLGVQKRGKQPKTYVINGVAQGSCLSQEAEVAVR